MALMVNRTGAPPPGRIGRERLTFNFGSRGTVPSRAIVEAAIAAAAAQPTFSTATYAEPRDWGYAGLLAFTTVLLFRPQDQIPGLNSLHVAEICALIGLLPMLLHRLARRQPVFRVTPETTALALFGAVILITAPFSVWPGGAIQEFTDEYAKVLLVFVLMMNTLTTPKRLDQVTWLILACVGYVALRGVIDYARGVNMIEGGSRLTGAVNGVYGNPNDLALVMATFVPVAAVAMIARGGSTMKRAVAAGITALMLATIVFTKSRGGMLGLSAGIVALLLIGRRVRPGFSAALLAILIAAAPFAPSSFWNRMYSIVDEKQDAAEFTGSREARRIVMQEAFDTFLAHPLTGIGAGQFQNYNPPGRRERWRETHNSPLQVAAETGIFGLACFAFLIGCAAVGASRTRRMLEEARRSRHPKAVDAVLPPAEREALNAHTVAMTASLVSWFVCSQFASVAYSWTFYYLLALIVAGRELTRDRLRAVEVLSEAERKPVAVPSAHFSPTLAARHA